MMNPSVSPHRSTKRTVQRRSGDNQQEESSGDSSHCSDQHAENKEANHKKIYKSIMMTHSAQNYDRLLHPGSKKLCICIKFSHHVPFTP